MELPWDPSSAAVRGGGARQGTARHSFALSWQSSLQSLWRFLTTSDAKTWPYIMLNLAALIDMPHELAAVLNHLHEGDIVCLIHVSSKIDAWVGDEKVGPFAHASFATGETRRAALWLHRTALKLFPRSPYARRWPARFSPLALIAGLWRPF